MSDSFRSILQPPPKTKILSNVNLLVVTNSSAELGKIVEPLHKAEVIFTCDRIIATEFDICLFQGNYSAVLYDNSQQSDRDIVDLASKFKLWCCTYPQTPLILITNPLGDEQAIKLVQSGVGAYVLKEKLHQLPQILETTLFNSTNKQIVATGERNLIQQQQKTIRQLQIEKQSWLSKEQLRQEHIAHLSHELRSPISSMLGFAGMLKEQYYGDLNDKQMQYVSALLSVGEHMLALVKNYLDLVKIDANKQTLDLERLAVEEICQASLHIVSDKAQKKALELHFYLEDNIDFCVADSVRLKQILVNLLTNAIKFTEQGSVTLDVKLKQDRLYFAVSDTGMGISAENMKKLFKPFPQISNHHESTGLGLALSRRIARLHGGDITVASKLGTGSCFTLDIPQYQPIEQLTTDYEN